MSNHVLAENETTAGLRGEGARASRKGLTRRRNSAAKAIDCPHAFREPSKDFDPRPNDRENHLLHITKTGEMNSPSFICDNGMIVCAAPDKKTGELTA